jgi:general nucleoside transport system ATP-binding protein
VSEELDEILTLSDRTIVMYEGRIAGEVTPPFDEQKREQIGLMMTGQARGTAMPYEGSI